MYVTANSIKQEALKTQVLTMKTVKGTIKIHAVVGLADMPPVRHHALRSAVIREGSLFQGVLGGRGG